MKQPPTIIPADVPGPDYDPMDQIVENLENIESFVDRLALKPHDLKYMKSHLPGILNLRRSIAHQLEKLEDEPYNYSAQRLQALNQENEMIFIFLERVIGTMEPWDATDFKKAVKAVGEALLKFDNELTP
jgi:hypothetical protein